MWQYNDTYELWHWGIKGMKWGQRRFQNKDGTLTPAGKKRYADDGSENVKSLDTKKVKLGEYYSIDAIKTGVTVADIPLDGGSDNAQKQTQSSSPAKTRRQSISDLSDDELRTIVNRKQSERQLRDLLDAEERYYNPPAAQNTQQQGQSMVSKVLRNAGEQALTTMAKGAMLYAGSTFVKNALNNPELARAIATGSMSGQNQKDDKKKDD